MLNEKVLEKKSIVGYTTKSGYLVPLICTLKYGLDDKFYVLCTLPHYKKMGKKVSFFDTFMLWSFNSILSNIKIMTPPSLFFYVPAMP